MDTPTVIAFTKVKLPYGWLGNMSPYPITFAGQTWRTSEALFQALRFAPGDPLKEEIRMRPSPMEAKLLARSYLERMVVKPCSVEDLNLMRLVTAFKLEQHPELQAELLGTGE